MTLSQMEPDRLESLNTYGLGLADTLDLGAVTSLAAAACSAPSAMVVAVDADSLIVVAAEGKAPTHLSRAGSLSSWVVDNHAELVVSDGRRDPRFAGHKKVLGGHVVAYAGVPLIGRDGLPLGVLCVSDVVPRDFGAEQLNVLRTLAQGVVSTLELHRIDRYRGVPADATAQGRRLRRALEQNELVSWFQPIVSLESGRPAAFEALVRWQHPQRGLVAPSEFLPAIEHSGLSLPLGRQVLHQSLRAIADLRSRTDAPDVPLVAVNVSPLQLERPGLAASVLADLAAHRIAPDHLALEVTEHALVRHGDTAIRELEALRAAGVRISLDDYGTGRASLQSLLRLPLTSLKLDGSFIAALGTDPRADAVVRSTISLATELGVQVIAEGIETEAQRDALVSLGCTLGQGHLYSPAVAPDDLPGLLQKLSGAKVTLRTRAREHDMVVAEQGADLLEPHVRGTRPIVLLATSANRVLIERTLAQRGLSVLGRPGYVVARADELLAAVRRGPGIDAEEFRRVVLPLIPRGATVWSDLAGVLWEQGEVDAAIEMEDLLAQLPASVLCSHEHWSLSAHGTPEQVRRLQEQHRQAVAPVPSAAEDPRAALRPDARELVDRMLAEGASTHSVAAALNAAGYPSPFGLRWHWRHVDRLRA